MADPAQAPDPDQLLAFITLRKAQAARIQEELTEALEQLSELLTTGEIDATFSFDDHAFNWSEGRRTFTYPSEVAEIEGILKAAKKRAEEDGSATPKLGTPFWTIRAPKP